MTVGQYKKILDAVATDILVRRSAGSRPEYRPHEVDINAVALSFEFGPSLDKEGIPVVPHCETAGMTGGPPWVVVSFKPKEDA